MRALQQKRAFHIPVESNNCNNVRHITRDGINADVYIYTNRLGKLVARCFGGRRSKPDSNYYYSTEDQRDKAVNNHFDDCERQQNYSKSRNTDSKTAERGLSIGEYLYCSWGYDQTNINFYKVVGLKGKKSVLILPVNSIIDSSNPPCNYVKPGDLFLDYDVLLEMDRENPQPVQKLAKNGHISISDYRASKWDGRPLYETTSGWGH